MLEVKSDPLAAVFAAAETAAAPVETAIARPALEAKAATITPPAKGGLGVPLEIDAVINRVLLSASPIRSIAQVVDIGSSAYRRLITTTGVVSGWVAETAARPETQTPDFAEIAPPMGELYANPAASQAMLDDAGFDVEAWLGEEIGREFARAEGVAFVTGDGINKPRGFLNVPNAAAADATRAFGTLQFVTSGAAGNFAASNPQDRLIDLVHALASPYRQGAVWVMNSATLARVRKFKTSDGAFIWQPGLGPEQPQTLLGHRVIEVDAMP
nr:phage major capsid protein [Sandarakinorhabdus sp.]